MYPYILFLHSLLRWLVLTSLVTSIAIASKSLKQKRKFTARHNSWRHWTATIAHIQLLLGMLLYFQSPVVRYPLPRDPYHIVNEHTYFRYIHITLMFIAVIVITIGSAKAKREQEDQKKFRTMLLWFSAGLLTLLIAIPWPFSPLAGRPLLRSF
jgi:cytochrome b561